MQDFLHQTRWSFWWSAWDRKRPYAHTRIPSITSSVRDPLLCHIQPSKIPNSVFQSNWVPSSSQRKLIARQLQLLICPVRRGRVNLCQVSAVMMSRGIRNSTCWSDCRQNEILFTRKETAMSLDTHVYADNFWFTWGPKIKSIRIETKAITSSVVTGCFRHLLLSHIYFSDSFMSWSSAYLPVGFTAPQRV